MEQANNEQMEFRYIICTPEGLAALQRLRDRKKNQGKKERNLHGKFKIKVVVRAVDVIRERGDVGISDQDLQAVLDDEFDLTSQEMTSVMRVIRHEVKSIVEAHCPDDETPKAS